MRNIIALFTIERGKILPMIGLVVATLLLASSTGAQPNLLKNPGFEAFTIDIPPSRVLADDSSTWGKWIAYGLWHIGTGGPDGNFAHQVTPSTQRDVSQQVMQAIDGSLVPSGTTLTLTFKYLFQSDNCYGGTKRVRVFGLRAGGEVSEFPSYDCVSAGSCTELYDDDQSAVPGDTLICDPPSSNAWRTYGPFDITVNENFEAIVVGIMFGGTPNDPSPLRAIDDVFLGVPNQPPDCSHAYPSRRVLWPPWPPDSTFKDIHILGVTDPENDPVTITIDKILQDEAVDTYGDGLLVPDGAGVGTSTAWVRYERAWYGDGRVYHIYFTADDGKGDKCQKHACTGEVLINIPLNYFPVIDSPHLFDSTLPHP
jgi:hypothetical protein